MFEPVPPPPPPPIDWSDPPFYSAENGWTGSHSAEDVRREMVRVCPNQPCTCVRCMKLAEELRVLTRPKAVDAWLAGKPPTVRFIISELEVGGVVHMRASSDEVGDDGPTGVGKTHKEALEDLERLLAKVLFS